MMFLITGLSGVTCLLLLLCRIELSATSRVAHLSVPKYGSANLPATKMFAKIIFLVLVLLNNPAVSDGFTYGSSEFWTDAVYFSSTKIQWTASGATCLFTNIVSETFSKAYKTYVCLGRTECAKQFWRWSGLRRLERRNASVLRRKQHENGADSLPEK